MSCRHNFKLRAIGSVYTCTKCDMYVSVEMYQQLQQAHRQGWEQARGLAVRHLVAHGILHGADILDAMEYGGKAND